MLYAEVATERSIDRTLIYGVPVLLEPEISRGQLVQVPLRTAAEPGIVVDLLSEIPQSENQHIEVVKPITDIIDTVPVVDADQIDFARWLSETYHAPLGNCLWLMLPPGLAGQRDIRVKLLQKGRHRDDPLQARILALLEKHTSRTGTQIQRSVKNRGWRKAVDALAEAEIVAKKSVLLPPKVKPQLIQVAALAIHPEEIDSVRRHLGKSNRAADLLQKILDWEDDYSTTPTVLAVLDLPNIGNTTFDALVQGGHVQVPDGEHIILPDDPEEALFTLRGGEADYHTLQVLAREDGPVDVSWVYAQTGVKLADLKRLADGGFIQLGEKRNWRDSVAHREFVAATPPRMTPAQREVWKPIRQAIDTDGGVFLLHGVTGSGKTEIYLRAIDRVLARGQQAIFLVPEIALTAQTIRRVAARFPGKVTILNETDSPEETPDNQVALSHSQLSAGERYDTWQRARNGQLGVVVGTRSALFLPLPDVGLVILDEEHDSSYKQSPPVQAPYYHARHVAETMMHRRGGTLILGSATPAIETYFRAQRGEINHLSLPQRIIEHRVHIGHQAQNTGIHPKFTAVEGSDALTAPMPAVDVVDMRMELKAGNREMFSRALQTALQDTLARGEQAILFMNRRGAATYVFCRDCGYVAECPRCDMPLTYHAHETGLHCHHCGYQTAAPERCPNCNSSRFRYFGAGTQEIETALKKHFPQAQALRWDADTASKPGMHDLILQRFSDHQAHVLIGTQMIAKGLDLPLVTLVGVVSADVGLALPDFRASERVFQVLAQVAGRAGRGLRGGKVILQTYQPEHYAIQAAAKHDYTAFYEKESALRREMGYPPFRHLVRILFTAPRSGPAQLEAQNAAELLKKQIKVHNLTGTQIIGPTPSFYERLNRLFRWQILLRGPDPIRVLDGITPGRGWHVDVDPLDIL